MAQYLDFTGLSKYDELIKALINKADSNLGSRIDAVVEDCGKNNSSLAEIISLIGNIENNIGTITLNNVFNTTDTYGINLIESSNVSINGGEDWLLNHHQTDFNIIPIRDNIDGFIKHMGESL